MENLLILLLVIGVAMVKGNCMTDYNQPIDALQTH